MDTSEQYIKMCAAAKEIQQNHKWIYGDCWSDDGKSVKIVLPLHFPVTNCIWLPRQDQLQAMVWAHTAGTYNLVATKLFAFSDYWEENGIPTEFISMEQLWLSFVQKELQNKVWDGKGWAIVKVLKEG